MKIYFQDPTDTKIVRVASFIAIVISGFLLTTYIMNQNLPDRQLVIITQIIVAIISPIIYLSVKTHPDYISSKEESKK